MQARKHVASWWDKIVYLIVWMQPKRCIHIHKSEVNIRRALADGIIRTQMCQTRLLDTYGWHDNRRRCVSNRQARPLQTA